MTKRTMNDEEFEEYFDKGGDTTAFKVGEVRQPGKPASLQRRVNFAMPSWLVDAIDAEARYLCVPRQSVVIMWLADRAKREGLDPAGVHKSEAGKTLPVTAETPRAGRSVSC